MKYKVGDLILLKDIHPRSRLPPLPRLPLRPPPHLKNTYGVIVGVEKHSEIFQKDSTENDNGYIWFSQVDGQEYYFYEDEVECEVK